MFYKQKFFLKGLHCLPPEIAHAITMKAIRSNFIFSDTNNLNTSNLKTKLGNLNFSHPLGIAAGFDKNVETINFINNLGISHMEFGTITPNPQSGNKKPRVFRLFDDQAIINRLGFPSEGIDSAVKKLSKKKYKIPIGLNIGCNKNSNDFIDDYLTLTKKLGPFAEWITVNISSPNTPGLRELQMGSNLHTLLKNINIERKKLEDKLGKILQVWLKISPDLNNNELKNLIDISVKYNIDALCISNTTTYRSNTLISKNKKEIGGLSGPPLFSQSTKMLAKAYLHASKSIKFIGIGGISNGETAYSKILAGADIIQLYTGLVFHGPQIINDIINYLDSKCKKTKISSISFTTSSIISPSFVPEKSRAIMYPFMSPMVTLPSLFS